MALKGQNLRIFMNGKCIAGATSCEITLGTQTENSSTKDSASNFDEFDVVGKNWSVSTQALASLDEDTSGTLLEDLMEAWETDEPVTVKFDTTTSTTSDTKNRTATNSAIARTGSAIITSVRVTGPNKQNSTFTVDFQGSGALTKVNNSQTSS